MGKRSRGNLTFHGPFLGSSAQLKGVSETFRVGLGKDPRHLFSCGNSSVGRAPPCQGGGRRFESGFPLWRGVGPSLKTCSPSFFRRRSQAVRQRPAKPLFPGSNPGGASHGWSPSCCRRPDLNRRFEPRRKRDIRNAAHKLTAEPSEDRRRRPQLNPGGVSWSRPHDPRPIGTAFKPTREEGPPGFLHHQGPQVLPTHHHPDRILFTRYPEKNAQNNE